MPILREVESYYIDPRYGVDTFGRISLDEYDKEEVKEVYGHALDYLEICYRFIEQGYGKPIPRNIDTLKIFFKSNYQGFVTR